MATIKDFILKSGLQVNTTITVGGIDVLANDFATYTTLQSEYSANDAATLLNARANDYSTYTTLQGEFAANDFATYSTLLSIIDNVASNVGGGAAAAAANDYNTYTTLVSEYRANDYATYTTLQGEFQANDAATLLSARANDYNTYTTLQSEFQANDAATLLTARANDYNTYTTLQSEFQANDAATLLTARANDYATYTTLVNEYNANDYTTYTTLQGELRANDYATWSGLNSFIALKANSSVNIVAGDGISGGGDLSSNVSIAVDSTVVRTSGDQSISGTKTFSDNVVVLGDLTVEGNTTTIGTTSLLVSDKFIELAANTVGTPAGDVGIYLNRGDFGNSAIYYDQAGGYFALAETADPSTNTSVSPTSYANLRISHLRVDSSDLVTNLNADLLDGQTGSYYSDFANASNTNYITLAYVTANGAVTSDSISVGGLTVDGDTLHVDSANDRVGINTLTPQAEFQVSNVALSTSIVSTTSTSSATLDNLPVSAFRTAKYIVQAHDTVTNAYQTSEILLIHDGVSAYLTEYAIIYTAGSLGSYDAALVSGDIRLSVTPASANATTFKSYRQAVTI
jgi:hypothetical protein